MRYQKRLYINPIVPNRGVFGRFLCDYTRYHEMPQKACERGFCHVIAFYQFFEMPHFSHFQNQIGKMGHFKKIEHKKVGHFRKLARDQFLDRK